jgi:hypothetical protein
MKVIDLFYKRAKGEKVPKRIRVEHWCYKFEWVEHLENYYDEEVDIDLTSAISMGEELNYEVEILDEEDEFIDIEEIDNLYSIHNYFLIINKLIKNQKKIIERLKDE